ALAAAGLEAADGAPRPRLGVVLGTAFGCFLTNADYQRRFLEGGPAAASPRLFAATVSNAAAGELAIAYRLGGPSVTLTAGAASGLVALGHAADLVRAGRGDALVAGGADALDDDLRRWRPWSRARSAASSRGRSSARRTPSARPSAPRAPSGSSPRSPRRRPGPRCSSSTCARAATWRRSSRARGTRRELRWPARARDRRLARHRARDRGGVRARG